MASCLKQIKLQDYVDGELSRAEAAEVAAHLAGCDRCRQVVADLQAVALPLRDLTSVPVPEELSARLLAAVAGLTPLAALTCAEAEARLSEALDGRLDFEASQRLRAHLDSCAACARLAREWGVLVEGLRAVPAEAAPAGLLQRILGAVAASQPRPAVAVWRRFATSAAGFAAAAAILLTIMLRSPALLPPAPGPVVAGAPPAIERVAPAAETQPTAKSATKAVAKPAAPTLASSVTRAKSLLAAARSVVRPEAARLAVATTPAPAPTRLPTPAAPAAPAVAEVVPSVASGPVTLAALPLTARTVSEHRVHADTAPRVAMPVATPVDRPATDAPVAPTAALPAAKATPTAEPTAAPEPERPRPTWVSRPAVGEREVYRSEERGTRLALARESLRTDMDKIDNWRPREWNLR